MTATAEQPRKGRKFAQVLEGAKQVFLSDGFEGASVDDIARAAGVSKATLYSYFPDKRHLFMEVATSQCEMQAEEAMQTVDMSHPPRVVLRQVARQFLGFILSDFGVKIFRICVAEAERFPELGREFYASGPQTVHDSVVCYLQQARDRGDICDCDLSLAADQFAELCKADLWPKLTFGIRQNFDEAEVIRVIDGAVDTFMARYGT